MNKNILSLLTLATLGLAGNIFSLHPINPEAQKRAIELVESRNIDLKDTKAVADLLTQELTEYPHKTFVQIGDTEYFKFNRDDYNDWHPVTYDIKPC